jgi:hypothetical protein
MNLNDNPPPPHPDEVRRLFEACRYRTLFANPSSSATLGHFFIAKPGIDLCPEDVALVRQSLAAGETVMLASQCRATRDRIKRKLTLLLVPSGGQA